MDQSIYTQTKLVCNRQQNHVEGLQSIFFANYFLLSINIETCLIFFIIVITF
jgi:hypothetical protein